MKLTKLLFATTGGLALTFLIVRLTFAAPAMAAYPAQRVLLDPTITPTVTITPTATPVPTVTVSQTHPVAYGLALYFHLPYTEVVALHEAGVGYGVIARAYLTAKVSNGVLSPTQVLEMFQSGQGWGQIKQLYGIHPGGNGLGSIMSGKAAPVADDKVNGKSSPVLTGSGEPAACPGNSCNAPGQNKPDKPSKK
ncbi:MAG: hypothetical protein KA765_06090 [Thermoflexales bacterium]|nr:hypothetical protein [Thermoflexales bacterium]